MFFGDKKKEGGAAIGRVTPDGKTHDEYAGGHEEDEILQTVAEELVQAVHAKDVKGVTQALRSFLACVQALDQEQDEAQG